MKPRVAMKFAINKNLKLPITNETIISLLFTLNQYLAIAIFFATRGSNYYLTHKYFSI